MPARRPPRRRPSSPSNAEAVITILTDAAAIDAVYNGASRTARGRRARQAVHRDEHRAAADRSRAGRKGARKGAAFVECPVGGSTGPARQGKLIGLMGAEPADAARAKPILDQLCRRLEHCGPVGSGAVMKLTDQHAADDLLAGARRGARALPPARPRSRADHGSALRYVRRPERAQGARAGRVAAMLKGGDGGPVTFDIDSAVKDLRTMLAEGKRARRRAAARRARRSPATRRPSETSRARRKSRRSRSIGRTARKP